MTTTGGKQNPWRITSVDGMAVARSTVVVDCPDCGGVGVIPARDKAGYEIVRPCHCRSLNRRIDLFNRARVPANYGQSTLDNFNMTHNESLADAHSSAAELVRQYPMERRGLVFQGPVGVGKTHLAAALVHALTLNKGASCRFCDFLHLLEDIKDAYGRREGTDSLMGPLERVDVLVIDDLGKGRGSEWELEILDVLVSRRYNGGGTTIATTNYVERVDGAGRSRDGFEVESLEQRVGARIHSRLHGMCTFIEMKGQDQRCSRTARRTRR